MRRPETTIIGVDIRDLRFAKTGQKTYLEELYKQFLSNQDKTVKFVFLDAPLVDFSRKSKMGILLNHLVLQFWKQVLLPIKAYWNKVDVLFCTDYFAPNIRLQFKNVQVFHDAFFYEYPEHYNRIWLRLFRFLAIPAARRSAYIIAPTHYAKSSIHQHIKIPLQNIVPIYEGPKTLLQPAQSLMTHEWQPPKENYILNVGVWEKRKNLPRLLASFKQVLLQLDKPIKLVLVGEGSKKMHSDDTGEVLKTIAQLGLSDHVICTGYLSDAALAIAYQNASVFIFPSYNEGFGVPILEAFFFKVPVLVANNSCLPEVGADAVLTFDPYSIEDMADKLFKVLQDQELQQTLIQKGDQRLTDFSWKKTSEQLVEVFKLAANKAPIQNSTP